MAETFGSLFQQNQTSDFGRQLTSWIYKPQKSNKFLFYILGLLGAIVIFLFTYGKEILPWFDKIPDYAIYVLFLLFGPLVNFFKSMGKNQEWTLFENGFVMRYIDKGNGGNTGTAGYWQDYKSAEYGDSVVELIPNSASRRKVKIRVVHNVMEVYSLCRERISIAQADNLQKLMRIPKTPNTPEQRRVAQLQQRAHRRSQESKWKNLFQG